ncbi:hypothetical protein Tco_0926270 [Tanacetum coccineum]|uniref:Uncharacterized protein n=1 Tax=Tanacetum coccineum TaxID=301880 RepID=A0ABQ5DCA0_9ASTR
MSLLTPSDIQHSAATQIWGCYRLVSRAKVIENQQSCLLHHLRLPTLPSTPTLSQGGYFGEPMRRYLMEAFHDGLPMQPVASPSLDYITGPEDEREPMFIQPHDPDYVPEPIYPEYIPLEDEHVFPVEEQPLPPVDSPTVELVSPPEGTEPIIPPSSTDISTTRARITVRL